MTRLGRFTFFNKSSFNIPFITLFSIVFGLLICIGSIFHSTVIQPLPYNEAHRLVLFENYLNVAGNMKIRNITGGIVNAIDKNTDVFESKVLHNVITEEKFQLNPDDNPFAIQYAYVSPNYFQLIKGRMLIGRPLSDLENISNDNPEVVISEKFWREKYSS